MSRTRKRTAAEAFELNMADADLLVSFAKGLSNQRQRKARTELRARLGAALRVPQKDQHLIDCVESDDAFVVIKPGSSWSREDLKDVRPLLRQALVAGCAATETYLADAAIAKLGALTSRPDALPARLATLQVSVKQWLEIESIYTRRRWGLHQIIAEQIRESASTSPSSYGVVLSTIGVADWSRKMDKSRRVPMGKTVEFLTRITDRRNKIAHQGDRSGQGRASLAVHEVEQDLRQLRSIVRATETILNQTGGSQ